MKDLINSIEFKRIREYLHSYYVPNLHNSLYPFYENILANTPQEKGIGEYANTPIREEKITQPLSYIFNSIVNNYYLVDKNFDEACFSAYVQDNNHCSNVYHNHINQTTLVGVTYLNPPFPKEGGEIEFWNPPHLPFKELPLKDFIYFFPSWMPHRPMPQTSPTPRISINWGYNCSKRPIHKITGDRW